MSINEKHLEFLQNNISRMNQCSFQMKGWAITIASAMVAFYISSITETSPGKIAFLYMAAGSSFLFWCLDSFYLSREKKFIAMYNDVIHVSNGKKQNPVELKKFEIPLNKYNGWNYCTIRMMFSFSEIIFYAVLGLGIAAMYRFV